MEFALNALEMWVQTLDFKKRAFNLILQKWQCLGIITPVKLTLTENVLGKQEFARFTFQVTLML